MVEKDIRFSTYLKAFFTDALTAMSGPISVPFAAAALWASSYWQKVLWGCLAVVSAGFSSYRVWRKERETANQKLAAKDEQISSVTQSLNDKIMAITQSLNEKITTLTQESNTFKAKVDVSLQADGTPPSQSINVKASVPVSVSQIEYMTTNDTCIVSENVSLSGKDIKVPVKHTLLTQLWNTPRPDRNHYDHSGPARIGLTILVNGKTHHLVMPVQMNDVATVTAQGTSMHRKITGSKTFIGL
jgi:hypothetical protein